jgi:hypothetical protein
MVVESRRSAFRKQDPDRGSYFCKKIGLGTNPVEIA